MATVMPSLFKMPGVLKSTFLVSTLFLVDNEGPIMAGKPDSFISAAIRCPSVQWSRVISRSYSLAILMAVKISSAL